MCWNQKKKKHNNNKKFRFNISLGHSWIYYYVCCCGFRPVFFFLYPLAMYLRSKYRSNVVFMSGNGNCATHVSVWWIVDTQSQTHSRNITRHKPLPTGVYIHCRLTKRCAVLSFSVYVKKITSILCVLTISVVKIFSKHTSTNRNLTWYGRLFTGSVLAVVAHIQSRISWSSFVMSSIYECVIVFASQCHKPCGHATVIMSHQHYRMMLCSRTQIWFKQRLEIYKFIVLKCNEGKNGKLKALSHHTEGEKGFESGEHTHIYIYMSRIANGYLRPLSFVYRQFS